MTHTMRAVVGGLLFAAAAIVVQILAGADYPVVPPGAVVFLAAAGLVTWRPRRWTAGVAVVIGLFLGVGALATSNTGDNLGSSSAFLVTATVVQLASLVAVIVTGAAGVLRPGPAEA